MISIDAVMIPHDSKPRDENKTLPSLSSSSTSKEETVEGEERVPCPICNKQISVTSIEQHVNSCLLNEETKQLQNQFEANPTNNNKNNSNNNGNNHNNNGNSMPGNSHQEELQKKLQQQSNNHNNNIQINNNQKLNPLNPFGDVAEEEDRALAMKFLQEEEEFKKRKEEEDYK